MSLKSDFIKNWTVHGGPYLANWWIENRGLDNKAGFLAFAQQTTDTEAAKLTGDIWAVGSSRFENLWRQIVPAVRSAYQGAVHNWRTNNPPPVVVQPVEGPKEIAEDPPPPPDPVDPDPPRNPDRGPPDQGGGVQASTQPVIIDGGKGINEVVEVVVEAGPDPETLFAQYMAGGNPTGVFWTLPKLKTATEKISLAGASVDFSPYVIESVESFGYLDVNDGHFAVVAVMNQVNVWLKVRIAREKKENPPEAPILKDMGPENVVIVSEDPPPEMITGYDPGEGKPVPLDPDPPPVPAPRPKPAVIPMKMPTFVPDDLAMGPDVISGTSDPAPSSPVANLVTGGIALWLLLA